MQDVMLTMLLVMIWTWGKNSTPVVLKSTHATTSTHANLRASDVYITVQVSQPLLEKNIPSFPSF
jgi:hypothetical protein